MKNQTLRFALIALVPAFILACDKKSDNPPAPPKTKTELITQAAWKFDNAKVGTIDVSAFLQACQKDNVVTFASNNTGTADEGNTKCNVADPQSSPFTWEFTSNESMLHVSTVLFTGGSSDFNIVALTEMQLIVSQNITVSGSTQNAIVTFKH